MGFIEQHPFCYLLPRELGEDGKKEERWLTQAPEDPLEKDEEPFEPESCVDFSCKNPPLDLEPLRNK